MIISVDYSRDRQILLVFPVEHFPYLLLGCSIRFGRPSTLYYRHLGIGKYGTNEKDDIGILPGELVDITIWSRYGSNLTLRLFWIWLILLLYELVEDTRIFPHYSRGTYS